MNKIIKIGILTLFFAPVFVFAQEYILLEPSFIGSEESDFIPYLIAAYTTILVIATVLAVLVMVVGAIQYIMTETIPGKFQGKSMMISALFGLIIVFGGWLILNTINPNLTVFNLNLETIRTPDGVNVNTFTSGGGGPRSTYEYTPPQGEGGPREPGAPADRNRFEENSPGMGLHGYVPANEFEVREKLKAEGITINDDGNCRPTNVSNCRTYVGGLTETQINGVINLKRSCNCTVIITGAAEQSKHEVNSRHYAGNAVDLRANNALGQYIRNNNNLFNWVKSYTSHYHVEFR